MGIMDEKNKIEKYLSSIICESTLDRLNACAYIYSIIEKTSDNSQQLFEYFLSTADKIDGNGRVTIDACYTNEDRKALEKKYGKLTDQILEVLLASNPDEHDFYVQLWSNISSTPLYSDRDSKIFALYYIWIDARIPYFKMESGLQMDNSEFAQRTENLRDIIGKARFILRTNYFSQRTARASELLALIDSVKDKKDQSILMAHVLTLAEQSGNGGRLSRILDQLLPDQIE